MDSNESYWSSGWKGETVCVDEWILLMISERQINKEVKTEKQQRLKQTLKPKTKTNTKRNTNPFWFKQICKN